MSLIHFFAYNIIFICVTTYLVYYFFAKKNNSFIQFLNNTEKTKLSLKKIIVGFTFGFIFGFIDNVGFGFGLSHIEKNLKYSNKINGLIANTYSDVMGAIIGTLISVIVDKVWKVDAEENYGDLPIYINALSIGFGCITGIFFVRFFLSN